MNPSSANAKAPAAAPAPDLVDPCEMPDWDAWVGTHPQATFFHGGSWARVLRDTYGLRPLYLAGFQGRRLAELFPMMESSLPLAGRKGTCLPFTDACAPCFEPGASSRLFDSALDLGRRRSWSRLEIRGAAGFRAGERPSVAYHAHSLELDAPATVLFGRCKSATRRAIRRAMAQGLQVRFEDSAAAMRTYYALHCITRKRQGWPPQPARFFESIQRHVLGRGEGFIALAEKDGRPLAGAIFFVRGGDAHFKFGASDHNVQHYRPNNLVLWEAIGRCQALGCRRVDFGRTSLSNLGLRRFKLGFGPTESVLEYRLYDFGSGTFVVERDRSDRGLEWLFRRLPVPALKLAGSLLYRYAV